MLASVAGQVAVPARLRKALVKDLDWTVKRPLTLVSEWLSGLTLH
jgi:hypothetical protein